MREEEVGVTGLDWRTLETEPDIPELQREIREREGLIEPEYDPPEPTPIANYPVQPAPREVYDQGSEQVVDFQPDATPFNPAQITEVLPIPLRCGLCGRRFALSPWDPAEGSFCPPDEGGCGATTKVSR